jgi:hypothetical protein
MGRGGSNLEKSSPANRYRSYRVTGGGRPAAVREAVRRKRCRRCQNTGLIAGHYYCGCLHGQERRVQEASDSVG